MAVLPFMPRYIGTLNVTHRDYPSTGDLTPPSPADPTPPKTPQALSPHLQSSSSITPSRAVTPLPEAQIDKNRHVYHIPTSLQSILWWISANGRSSQNGY